MFALAFFHNNIFRCADVIHCIPAAIHPDHSAASQWIRRSFSEKQFDRIPRESFYEISRRFHSFEGILLSFLHDLCSPDRDKAHIHDVPGCRNIPIRDLSKHVRPESLCCQKRE